MALPSTWKDKLFGSRSTRADAQSRSSSSLRYIEDCLAFIKFPHKKIGFAKGKSFPLQGKSPVTKKIKKLKCHDRPADTRINLACAGAIAGAKVDDPLAR